MNLNKLINKIYSSVLLKNIGVYTFGSILQKAAEFLLIPIFTRYLTPKDYGVTGILLSYIGVILPFLIIGLQGYITFIYYQFEKDKEKLKTIIFSIFLFQLFISALVTILFILAGGRIWAVVTNGEISFNPFAIITILICFFESINAIPMALYQIQHKAMKYMRLQLGIFSLNVVFSILLVVIFRLGAQGKMLSTLLPYAIIGLYNAVSIFISFFSIKIDFQHIFKGLSYGIPLIPHSLSGWALTAADRMILVNFVSLESIGLYNFGYSVGTAMNVIVNAINLAWMPHYFQVMNKQKDPNSTIIKELSQYIIAIGAVCLVGILFNYEVIYYLLPKAYRGATIYIGPILLGYFFVGLNKFAIAPLFFYKKTSLVPLITGASAITNIGLNFLLIPIYGPIASAWVTTFSYLLVCVISFFVGNKLQHANYPFVKYGMFILFLIISAVLVNKIFMINIVFFSIKVFLLIILIPCFYFLINSHSIKHAINKFRGSDIEKWDDINQQ